MTIAYTGNWTEADKHAARHAISMVSFALDGGTERDEFNDLFGDLTFEARKSLPGRYHGYVVPGDAHRILFRIGKVTPRLVIHELGHLCNDNVPEDESPAYELGKYGIKTPSGKWVTGFQGYLHRGYPWQQHPPNWKNYNTSERWADMLLAWVYGEFADNEAGDALNAWVGDYLTGRLEA
jgi:hypothetical protein